MPQKDEKVRKKIVVEEVDQVTTDEPKAEAPVQAPPPAQPGVREEVVDKPPDQPTTDVPLPTKQPSGPSPFVIIIPGIFLLGALLGGIFFYQSSVNNKPQPTPTPVETLPANTQPTATPQPKEVDLTKYPISILNGSGIKGEAGKAQDLLEKAGFKVSSTGNASNYNYTETIIQIKSGAEEGFVTKLKETLGESYKVAAKQESLPASSKDDIVVIVGSSKP